jgi:ribosomal protein S18 acetylase RimI-like enzyme/predicted double-glycine peptidase
MRQKFRIRLATEHDINALLRLEEIAFETDRFTREQLDYLLTESPATTFILENKISIVGSACVVWRKSHQSARLYNVAVDPAYQRSGIGVRLLDQCDLEAARRGRRKMTLNVSAEDAGAIRFYEKNGYEVLGTIEDYYEDGSAAYRMSKALDLEVPEKIRYNVPYYSQTLDFTCGPACLMMALKYFYPDSKLTRALEMTLWKEATLIFMASGFGGTDGFGLALSALNRGLTCYIIMSMDSTPMLRSVRIPQKREVMRVVHTDLKRKAFKAGLGSAVYDYGMDDIIAALHRGMLPIVMISTYRLTGDRVPHWVVVTGIDRDHVFIHDPDVASYKKNRSRARHLRIEKDEFLQMSSYGKEVYRCLLLVAKSPLISAGRVTDLSDVPGVPSTKGRSSRRRAKR